MYTYTCTHTYMKSLYCIPKTNIMSNVNYISIKIKNWMEGGKLFPFTVDTIIRLAHLRESAMK